MSYTEEQYLKNTKESFAAGREVGVSEERERIIKLLEASEGERGSLDGTKHEHSADWDYCSCMLEIRWPDLIALIKGTE